MVLEEVIGHFRIRHLEEIDMKTKELCVHRDSTYKDSSGGRKQKWQQ